MTTALTGVEEALDRLAAFSSPSDPVVSLYLNLQSDAHGRREYTDFLDRAFRDQIDTFESGSSARRHLEQDAQRIRTRIESELQTSTRTLAVFCCSGDPALFEAIELDAPIDGHRLYIDHQPHLFPLARLTDQYRRYAALLLDTHSARLFVFAVGAVERKTVVENEKPSRTPGVDVWSEGEYQRNSENLHVKHMKEVADMVERVVREEDIATIVVAADEVALPLFKEAVSSEVQENLVEVRRVGMFASDADVLRATIDAFKQADAVSDRDFVTRAIDAFRSRGLGTIGLQRVRAALTLGQVDRLLVPAVASVAATEEASGDVGAAIPKEQRTQLSEAVIEELVMAARRTDAATTFVEDATLLRPAGGVAALLRFKLKHA